MEQFDLNLTMELSLEVWWLFGEVLIFLHFNGPQKCRKVLQQCCVIPLGLADDKIPKVPICNLKTIEKKKCMKYS